MPRIRGFIRVLQHRTRAAEAKKHRSVVELHIRQDAIFDEISKRADRLLPLEELSALRGMSTNCIRKFRALSKILEAAKPA